MWRPGTVCHLHLTIQPPLQSRVPFPHGQDAKDGGILAMTQNPEQLKEEILYMFSDILKAWESSLWALPERMVNDASRRKGISTKASVKEHRSNEEEGRRTGSGQS